MSYCFLKKCSLSLKMCFFVVEYHKMLLYSALFATSQTLPQMSKKLLTSVPPYFDLSQYSVAVVVEYQKALKKGENGIDIGSFYVIFFVVLQQKQVSSKHRRVCQIYCFSTSALRQRSGDDLTSNGKSGGGDRGGNGGSKGSQLCCPKCGEPCTHVETFVCK